MGRFLRKSDWAECLNVLVADRMHTPFQWGVHDCALFAADAVHCITGRDPAADIRGTYSTAAGAASALSGLGLSNVGDTPEAFLGAGAVMQIKPNLARRGDILEVINAQGSPMLAVCLGAQCVAPGESGLIFSSTSQAAKAWRIKSTKLG